MKYVNDYKTIYNVRVRYNLILGDHLKGFTIQNQKNRVIHNRRSIMAEWMCYSYYS